MTTRELPGFLLAGDAETGLPRLCPPARMRAMVGYSVGDTLTLPDRSNHDPAGAAEQATREWLAHVAAGRIGG